MVGRAAYHDPVGILGAAENPLLRSGLALAGADRPVVAVHIDHGLQAQSGEWASHCAAFSESLGIGFQCRKVEVQLESGKGPEASARDARYSALHAELAPGDWLLSAHHREDQAETLLLNLVRGSGPAGLAAMPQGSIKKIVSDRGFGFIASADEMS